MLGTDSVQRRESSVKHVISAVEAARLLNCGDIRRLLNDTYKALVARWAGAVYTGIHVSNVVADRAEVQTGFHLPDGIGEQLGIFIACAQDVKGEPLRGLAANSRQLLELIDEPGHRFCKFGQRVL